MIKGVLLDVSGVLYSGSAVIPGAVEAIERLRNTGLPFRLVSNTSRKTARQLLQELSGFGFEITPDELLTAPLAARTLLAERELKPFLLVHPELEAEFDGMTGTDAVLVADAGEAFTHARLDAAFRLLVDGAPLYATGVNRYFRNGDGLSLDAGPFVRALEYAAGVRAIVTGKPSREFFQAAARSMDIPLNELVMIGDDVENDVLGAREAGLDAMLVRTGKFQAGDEKQAGTDSTVSDVTAAVDRILQQSEH